MRVRAEGQALWLPPQAAFRGGVQASDSQTPLPLCPPKHTEVPSSEVCQQPFQVGAWRPRENPKQLRVGWGPGQWALPWKEVFSKKGAKPGKHGPHPQLRGSLWPSQLVTEEKHKPR